MVSGSPSDVTHCMTSSFRWKDGVPAMRSDSDGRVLCIDSCTLLSPSAAKPRETLEGQRDAARDQVRIQLELARPLDEEFEVIPQ